MIHPNVQALHSYWDELRAGRKAPFRSEIDPRAISGLLDSTFILERLSRVNVRFRLAGTRLCDLFGMELRGMSAFALWRDESRDQIRDLLADVTSRPCVGRIEASVENGDGSVTEAEFVFMPLCSDFGELSRIVGCAYQTGEETRRRRTPDRPRLFWARAIERRPFWIQPEQQGAPRGFADEQTPFQVERRVVGAPDLKAIDGAGKAAAGEARSRDHLRLVKDE